LHRPDKRAADVLVALQDQLGTHPDAPVTMARFLCVPSIKTVVPTPQLPSLAPWGIATLGVLMLLTVLGMARRRTR
jgi:hypothetical protein